ncbi:gene transfer agent family protein [Rhodophyticola sp. CCM32]|uniref:gene transfer agent family protein n=1 Tax=Rhodophyticola sp. CCM32 TaxID=2916397 RepID=UPI00107FC78C|nr:gene transfer agent family protein [Rhodophyticola sp. CCM32]QBX99845.1 gene transfer agent family protein [Rhodophyticola sp. CCM32]
MANPLRGEVALVLDGERRVCKLTLGALAELEDHLQADSLAVLVDRFESGSLRARDVLLLISAGLRGGGWSGDLSDLLQAEIEGGPLEAARVAARMLALAFRPPQ